MQGEQIISETKTLKTLLELAAQYGVTFFAVLFVVYVTYWANRQYKEAMARKPHDAAEIKTKRRIYVASFVSGLVLVAISVVFTTLGVGSGRIYVARGVIKFVAPSDKILPEDDIYFREVPRWVAQTVDDSLQVSDQHFILVKSTPFAEGEVFHIDLAKPSRKPTRLKIAYHKTPPVPAYQIEFDTAGTRSILVPLDSQSVSSRGVREWLAWLPPLIRSAYAQARPVPSQPAPPQVFSPLAARDVSRLVDTLQASRSSVSGKLDALDFATKIGPDQLDGILVSSGKRKEPFLSTLLDLTRHSDPEVAAKASFVLRRGDYQRLIVDAVSSPDQGTRKIAEDALFRMDRVDATKLVSSAKSPSAALRARLATDTVINLLRPTGSQQGDRYYVQAHWDSTDDKARTCLTKLFNKALISNRTLDQETRLMRGKSDRLVYWYDKDWAEGMAKDIRSCGAKASYVTPFGSK